MTSATTYPPIPPEVTDLERRVLAHERILQSLIAYMSRTEPRFVDHLREMFVEPMTTARREHDYRDADDYAEEFIRAVMLLGAKSANKTPDKQRGVNPVKAAEKERLPKHPYGPIIQPDRVQLRERNGIWEVKVDGVFRGDYHQKESALAAAALARLSL